MDRQTIVKTVKGGQGTATDQVFGPSTGAYDEKLEDAYPYDLDKAKQLMAEAGYADGLSMTLPDFSPVYPDEQAAMTEAFASLGIDVTYAPITGDQVVGSIIGGQWPANFFNLTAGSPFEMIGLTLTPQSPFTPFKTADPEVDRLVQQAQTTSGDEQTAALQELNRYLVDQAWFAPWAAAGATYTPTRAVAVPAGPGVGAPPLPAPEPAGS